MKPTEMYVSSSDPDCKMKDVRVVLYHNNYRNVLAVYHTSEKDFENGKSFSTSKWNYCKQIPKRKTRYMTRDEILGKVLTTPMMLVRSTNGYKWYTASSYAFATENTASYLWAIYDPEVPTHKLEPNQFLIEE